MNDALRKMLERYDCVAVGDYVVALREVLQRLALLGLWRSKFFDKAAFYGGTALRILYGLDRFSEDLDFSLLRPSAGFRLEEHHAAMVREMEGFGFHVTVEGRAKKRPSAIRSAFVKANTRRQLLAIDAGESVAAALPANQTLKVRVEVDTDPPGGFETENKYVLQPMAFSVRTFCLPDLFAGKMHAVLCRRWKTRVKGRDWYDLVWFASHHPRLHLSHLEERMKQTGDWAERSPLTPEGFRIRLNEAIDSVDLHKAAAEVAPFLKRQEALKVWSQEFFREIAGRIEFV